jgi:hypothetical protein
MKIKSVLLSLMLAASAAAFLMNCSAKKEEAAEAPDKAATEDLASGSSAMEAAEPQFQVDGAFQQQLGTAFTSYVELKDAFVASDAARVKEEASSASDALTKVDMKLLSGAAHNDWMNYLPLIQNALKEIQNTTDIETQRKAFSTLSDNMYKSIKAFGLGGKEAFYEYCPMAFNNSGAYWLSDKGEIRNPYFGDRMLTCGEVREKLK